MTENRVGIMTFHRSHNCGSLLQSYALHKILRDTYHMHAEIIDFSNKAQQNYYLVINPRPKVRGIWKNFISLPHYKLLKKYRDDYVSFISQHLHLSDGFYETAQELDGIEENYDLVIAGSDQVWNIMCVDADPAYFLNFVRNTPKASYATSMGRTSIKKYAGDPKAYGKLLESFQLISVREPNAKKWVEELIGRTVPIVLDPTLLYTGEEWAQQFTLDEIEGEYIFFYAFTFKKKTNQIVKAIADRLGMPVFVIEPREWALQGLSKYGFRLYEKTGPLAFLSLMKNASLVITASFHGTVFATLFKRPFWSFANRQIQEWEDDRSISILRLLGLKDRYRYIGDLPKLDLMAPIDYDSAYERLAAAKSESYRFLEAVIGLTGGGN